jgi:hypothetical protein
VQKPHWLAPVEVKASTQRSSSAGSRPSTVVTDRPATRRTGVTQETRGSPSTHTVQQPHWPWGLHPSLTEGQPNSSRRASRRVIPSSTATGASLRMKETAAGAAAVSVS